MNYCIRAGTALLLAAQCLSPLTAREESDAMHEEMLDAIQEMVAETAGSTGIDRLSPAVLDALRRVPRAAFVPDDLRDHAWRNQPLPIGHGQTISQPYIVALMTQLAGLDAQSTVLEVGTGSGYQAAVLAAVAGQVYSVEIIAALGRQAAQTLARLGYANVHCRTGDGYQGWPEHAPYDAILVTAAPEQVPQPLLDQLKPGGRLVIPVGPPGAVQSLRLLVKDAHGVVHTREVLPVGFVPLTRDSAPH